MKIEEGTEMFVNQKNNLYLFNQLEFEIKSDRLINHYNELKVDSLNLVSDLILKLKSDKEDFKDLVIVAQFDGVLPDNDYPMNTIFIDEKDEYLYYTKEDITDEIFLVNDLDIDQIFHIQRILIGLLPE